MDIDTAFEILGFTDKYNVTKKDVKNRYRELALKIHPDKNPNNPNANEEFQELSNAYEIIKGNPPPYERPAAALPKYTAKKRPTGDTSNGNANNKRGQSVPFGQRLPIGVPLYKKYPNDPSVRPFTPFFGVNKKFEQKFEQKFAYGLKPKSSRKKNTKKRKQTKKRKGKK
jgi:curved DNA-binding protein CbpA